MIETKQITTYNNQDYVKIAGVFGWQLTDTISRHSGKTNHHYYILARDTNIEHYYELRKYDTEYEQAKKSIQPVPEISVGTTLLLGLFFIIPGVLYYVVKSNNKNKIIEHNYKCERKMADAVAMARMINK